MRTGILLAGMASLGAGAIHAAAVGAHAEAEQMARLFTAVAAVQLAWGGLALLRSHRAIAALGVLVNGGAFAGWIVSKTIGIGFVEGMGNVDPIQTADATAAGLALLSVLFAAVALVPARSALPAADTGTATPSRSWSAPLLPALAAGVTAIAVVGMGAAGTHQHDHGSDAMSEVAAGATVHEGAHGDADAHDHPGTVDADGGVSMIGMTSEHGDAAHTAAPPVPYDPTKPLDFGGVEGVTPEQQAAAENVVAVTLHGLPQWADASYAEANGFASIGDGLTGTEHLINQANMDDDVILDPDKPESLVYSTEGGGRRLVAAMYMMKRGTPLEDAPLFGGALTQWHIHNNLCYRPDGRLGGLTDAQGNCRPGLIKPVETPMIHVWIEPHPCGPFAALEGIGGGEVKAGEEKLCDHAHGAES